MLDHVSITVPDIVAVAGFYDAVMQALGYPLVYEKPEARGYGLRAGTDAPMRSYISVYQSAAMQPDSRRHWCSKGRTVWPSKRSMRRPWRMAAGMTARPACDRIITRAILQLS